MFGFNYKTFGQTFHMLIIGQNYWLLNIIYNNDFQLRLMLTNDNNSSNMFVTDKSQQFLASFDIIIANGSQIVTAMLSKVWFKYLIVIKFIFFVLIKNIAKVRY